MSEFNNNQSTSRSSISELNNISRVGNLRSRFETVKSVTAPDTQIIRKSILTRNATMREATTTFDHRRGLVIKDTRAIVSRSVSDGSKASSDDDDVRSKSPTVVVNDVKFNVPVKSLAKNLAKSFSGNHPNKVIHKPAVRHNTAESVIRDNTTISCKPETSQKPLISRKPSVLKKAEPPTPPPKPPRSSLFFTKLMRSVEDLTKDVKETLNQKRDEFKLHKLAAPVMATENIEFNDSASFRSSSDSFESWNEEDDEEDAGGKQMSRYSITRSTADLFDTPISQNVILHIEKLFKHNPASLPSKNNIIKNCRIIQELVDNEKCYIDSLKQGIDNYIQNYDSELLPTTLKGQKRNFFSNIEAIHEFHKSKVFPKLLECDFDPEKIANVFTSLIDGYQFDIYVIYVLNRKKSEVLVKANEYYFKQLQRDRLGISSFLIQPIQRLPRYQLLLAEIIKNLMKDLDNQKSAIAACCIAEKQFQRLLNNVNEYC